METNLETKQSTSIVARIFISSAFTVSGLALVAAGYIFFTTPKSLPLTAGQKAVAAQLRSAAASEKVDPFLRQLVYRASVATSAELQTADSTEPVNRRPGVVKPNSLIEVMIEVGNEVNIEQIESAGADVRTQAGGVLTASVIARNVPALLALDQVRRVTAAAGVELLSDVSVPETNADDLWKGDPPTYGAGSKTGEGVVVGIVDTGIDYLSDDFRNSDNTSRILYAWDQQWSGLPPAGFGYGVQYTQAQLTAGTATEFADYNGHGTNLASIAAANGRLTGDNQPAYRYVGVAPKADLIVVKAYDLETQVIDAVNYIFQRAGCVNVPQPCTVRPAVVNLSLGISRGPRDGTYAFDKSLSALTGPGKIITAGMGNNGMTLMHGATNLSTAGSQTDLTFNIPSYTPSQSQTEYVTLEGWHGSSSEFDIQLLYTPTGQTTPQLLLPVDPNNNTPIPALAQFTTPGTTTQYVQTRWGTVYLANDIENNLEDPQSPRYAKRLLVQVAYGTPGTPRPAAGDWTIRLRRRSGGTVTSGVSDWWVTQYFFAGTGSNRPLFKGAGADSEKTILSPASADDVIATGAYGTKYSWANDTGSTSRYSEARYPNLTMYPTGLIANFSSRGPRRDGVVRPDVVAPGYGVMGATSRNANVSATYRDPDGVHDIRKGTSQASAHTAGVVALLMQGCVAAGTNSLAQCPTPSAMRTTLIQYSWQDAFTKAHPCPQVQPNSGTCPAEPIGTTPTTIPVPNQFYGNGKLGATPIAGGDPSPPEPSIRRR